MMVVTAILLFVLLVFAPIRFRVDLVLYLQKLSATVVAKVDALRVFDETLTLQGQKLHCQGTVSTDVDLKTVDKKTGIDLLNCLTVDKVCLSLCNNMPSVSMFAVAMENALAAIVTSTLCNLFHCQFYTQVVGCMDESKIRVQVDASVSIAELSFCLLMQGVRLWKTRKLEKS